MKDKFCRCAEKDRQIQDLMKKVEELEAQCQQYATHIEQGDKLLSEGTEIVKIWMAHAQNKHALLRQMNHLRHANMLQIRVLGGDIRSKDAKITELRGDLIEGRALQIFLIDHPYLAFVPGSNYGDKTYDDYIDKARKELISQDKIGGPQL